MTTASLRSIHLGNVLPITVNSNMVVQD